MYFECGNCLNDIRSLSGYLCSLEANIYNIEFTRFKIRDMESQAVLFEISKPADEEIPPELPPDASRFVRYQFPPDFLKLKSIGATYVRNYYIMFIKGGGASHFAHQKSVCISEFY